MDYRWIDDRFLEATNQVFDKSDDYWVANMRVALATEKWEVAVYGTNLFDEDYLTYINNIGFLQAGRLRRAADLRRVGALPVPVMVNRLGV